MPLREVFRASEPTDVEAAQRRLALAQALQQQAMQPRVPVQTGSVTPTYGAGNALVDLAGALAAAYNTRQANTAYTRAKQAQGAKVGSAMQELQGSIPDAQVGSQALQNLRASGSDELPQEVTPRSTAQNDLASAMGPDAQQQIAGALLSQSMTPPKPEEPYTLSQGQTRFNAKSQPIASVAKPDEEKPLDEVAKLNADLKAGRITQADYDKRYKLMTERAPGSAAGQGFEDPKIQALQAAMATAGISLPAGLRSQAQQLSVLRGLMARNPDKTPDEIVANIRTGQLDFNGAKRSTAQIAQAAAVTDAASKQLEKNFAAMEPLVSKMGTTSVPIIDRSLAQLRQNLSSGGDKDTAAFIVYLRAVAGEYAKLKSGGIGSAAPAEGEMRDALSVMQNAFSVGGYQGIKEALLTEAQNKRASYQEGLEAAAHRSSAASPPASATPAASTLPPDIAELVKKHGGK